MRQRKISFIVTNYNTRELLEKCIDNLDMIYPNMQIIVIDNDSSDGSREMVRVKYADRVILIESENKGLSHAYNMGLRIASGYYVCYMGTDAYPTERAIKRIREFMDHYTYAAVATPRLVLRDGTFDNHCHRGFPNPWNSFMYFSGISRLFPKSKWFNGYYLGHLDIFTRHEVDSCISHFMFVRKNIHEIIGMWDEDYFLYGEDIDICYRVKQAGYQVMYLGDIEVLHYKGVSVIRKESNDLKNDAKSNYKHQRRITYESTHSMRIFYSKHYSRRYPFFITGIIVLGVLVLEKFRLLRFDVTHLFGLLK